MRYACIFVMFALIGEYRQRLHTHWWAHYQSFHNNSGAALWFDDLITKNSSIVTINSYVRHLYVRGLYQELVIFVNQNKGIAKGDFDIAKWYALSLIKLGKDDLADSMLVRCAQNFKDDIEICFYAAQSALRKGNAEQALAFLQNYIDQYPYHHALYMLRFMQAQIYVYQGDQQKALSILQEVIHQKPNFDKAWLLYAIIHQGKSRYHDAIHGYKQYLACDPQVTQKVYNEIMSVIARNEFAITHQEKRSAAGMLQVTMSNASDRVSYEHVVVRAKAILRTNPTNINAICTLIEASYELHDYHQMSTCIIDQIERDPAQALWHRLLLLCCSKSQSELLQALNRMVALYAIKKLPELAQLLLLLFDLVDDCKENIAELINQTIDITTDHMVRIAFLHVLADWYEMQNDEHIVIPLSRILEEDCENIDALKRLSWHCIVKKNFERASTLIDTWSVFQPCSVDMLHAKAFLLHQQGDTVQAKKLFEQLLRDHPEDKAVFEHYHALYPVSKSVAVVSGINQNDDPCNLFKSVFHVVCVAGKSGGHIIPCITLAQRYIATSKNGKITFFSGTGALDKSILDKAKVDAVYQLPFVHVPSQDWHSILHGCYDWMVSLLKTMFEFVLHPPDCVVTTGGIIALPVVMVARIFGIPVHLYILDAVPGQASVYIAPYATHIYCPFATTLQQSAQYDASLCNYPIRYSQQECNLDKGKARIELGLHPHKKTIVVLGGSQGSQFINQVVYNWLKQAKFRNDIQIIHQYGNDIVQYQGLYDELGIAAYAFAYRHDLAPVYAAADLIIGRAGAGTIFESLAFQKHILLIPLETEMTQHQVDNAYAIQMQYPQLVTVVLQKNIEKNSLNFYHTIERLLTL